MIVAVIDIGTNTVLLLVAEILDDGRIRPLLYEQRVPRLGLGVDATRRLQTESMSRVMRVLEEYLTLLSSFQPVSTVLCGTSALRDASNSADLTGQVQRDLGLRIEILTGEEEALLTYKGALSGHPDLQRAVVLDIGGGSTEVSAGDATRVLQNWSLDIGSVRVTERFFKHDPPENAEIDGATRWIQGQLGTLSGFDASGHALIGVAGTATTLAVLVQGLEDFEMDRVANCRISRAEIKEQFARLKRLSHAELHRLTPAMKGRADVITAGTLILQETMEKLECDELIVSERGVRYGIALREWEKRRMRL